MQVSNMSETTEGESFNRCLPTAAYLIPPSASCSHASASAFLPNDSDTHKIAIVTEVDNVKDLVPSEGDRARTEEVPKISRNQERQITKAKNEDKMKVPVEKFIEKHNRWRGQGFKNKQKTKVKEPTLATLFDVQGEISFNGLPVGLVSKPAFAFKSKDPNIEEGVKVYVMGEGKNSEQFTTHDCQKQCVAYMLANLHYLVVEKKQPVGTVYGFALSGPQCSNVKNGYIHLDLMSLSLPETIGGKIQLRFFSSKNISDLERFLCIIPNTIPRKHVPKNAVIKLGCPSLLKIPMEKLLKPNGEDGKIVMKNATAALVLKYNSKNALQTLIDTLLASIEYKQSRKRARKRLDSMKSRISEPCYVKVKNYLGIKNPTGKDYRSLQLDEPEAGLDDIYAEHHTYDGVSFIFMNDMGDPLTPNISSDTSFAQFVPLFSDLKRRIEAASEMNFVHGDIHLWNVVYKKEKDSKGKLHLIDYDEGTFGKLMKREHSHPSHIRRYVNDFNDLPSGYISYTKNQIVNLYCECWDYLFKEEEAAKGRNYPKVEAFKKEYYEIFRETKTITTEQVKRMYRKMEKQINGPDVTAVTTQFKGASLNDNASKEKDQTGNGNV